MDRFHARIRPIEDLRVLFRLKWTSMSYLAILDFTVFGAGADISIFYTNNVHMSGNSLQTTPRIRGSTSRTLFIKQNG